MNLAACLFITNLDGVAAAGSERLLYSTVAGTLLAVAVWFLLQLFPKRDSRTSFAVWFSTLLATAVLPLLRFHTDGNAATNAGRALVTFSTSWAWYIFLAWAAFALIGLVRVAVATWHVRRLRRATTPVDLNSLPADLRALIEEFQQSRPVMLLISQRLEVPTAIGFRSPAIILPAWLLESTPAEELKYILLHELAHLSRRDDWTNLAQKILKALLFFLPSVWWIERRLSMDREVACDDAVLARSGTPRGYAECLARLAEKSFLRRQLALAQAAVGRMRQLTSRVAIILDPNRQRRTQYWKPAIPVVMVLAVLCALPASFTSQLVSFEDNSANPPEISAQQHLASGELAQPRIAPVKGEEHEVRVVEASFKADSAVTAPAAAKSVRPARRKNTRSKPGNGRTAAPPTMLAASYREPEPEQYVTVREDLYFQVTQRTPSGEQQSWQVHLVQLSVQPQSKPVIKPRKI
ncbi:MAG TPA: M56 family metallopeptidase [Candidatus Angelobacter sp.]|nr:M56 family metallopeptidase [Candidatus Angelobacter sp.]